jgi:hypothetical protein
MKISNALKSSKLFELGNITKTSQDIFQIKNGNISYQKYSLPAQLFF